MIGGNEMYQVSPEDQLTMVKGRQAELRTQSANEQMARRAAARATFRRSHAARIEDTRSHRLVTRVMHLIWALTARPASRPRATR